MDKCKKELIHKAVDKTFRYYESRGYDGHLTQPQIIEESKQFAEKLVEAKMQPGVRIFNDYTASIATYLACESRGCPINLKMAKESTKEKIKIADLQKAREITGKELRMTAVDWIDGVVRTLKNKNIISDKQESEIIEKTALEIPKVQRASSPRYKAIIAVYQAMKNSGIEITQLRMHNIFNVSEQILRKQEKHPKSYRDNISNNVSDFLRKNEGLLYESRDLIKALGLDIKSANLGRLLSSKKKELGFQIFMTDSNRNFYTYSDVCTDTCGENQECLGFYTDSGSIWHSKCKATNKPTFKRCYEALE